MPYHLYATGEHHNPRLFLSRYHEFLTRALDNPTIWVHTDACMSISIAKKRAQQQKYFVRCLRAFPGEFPELSQRLQNWGIRTHKPPFSAEDRAKMRGLGTQNVPLYEVIIKAIPRNEADDILDEVLGHPD